jgi:ribosomal protein S24E
MKVIEKKEKNNEALLSRKEYKITIEFSGPVPKKEDTKKELSRAVGCSEELAVVRKITTGFGSDRASVDFLVYSNADELKRIEGYLMHSKILEKMQKKAGAQTAPAQEAK